MCGRVVLVVVARVVLVSEGPGVVGVCAAASLPGPDDDEPSLRLDDAMSAPTAPPASTATAAATSAMRRARPRCAAQRSARDKTAVVADSGTTASGTTGSAVGSPGAGFSGAVGGSDTTPNAIGPPARERVG
jgi:hypothetical protein